MWSYWFLQLTVVLYLGAFLYFFADNELKTEIEYLMLFVIIMVFFYCEIKLLL